MNQTETTTKPYIVSYVIICPKIQVIEYIDTTLYKYTCKYLCNFNPQGQTPLHKAAFSGNTQLVELLIEKEADPNYRDGNVSINYIWS